MVRGGMTPAQAIRSATVDAARLLGGRPSWAASRRAMTRTSWRCGGDPLADVSLLRQVAFVMKGGVCTSATVLRSKSRWDNEIRR